ncbi:MAG: NAD-dependent epimerase/dehydratase family protein [Nitrosospira sp.]
MNSIAAQDRDVVVITGGAGFIGAAVASALAERFRVVALDREMTPHPQGVAECICIDLTSDESIVTALARLRIAYGDRIASVIHLAAYSI